MKWIIRILAILGGLLLLAAVALAVAGRRSGAGDIHVSTEIGMPPERLWPWLHESEKAKMWVSWLVEVREIGPRMPEVGSKEIWVMKDPNMGGALIPVEGTCTEYSPPSRLSVRLASAAFSGRQSYVLTPAGQGRTRLEVTGHFDYPNWFAQLMEPLITPEAQKKMAEDIARLKSAAEHSGG